MKIIANENVTEMKKSVSTRSGKLYADEKIVDSVKDIYAAHQMSHGSHRVHGSG